MRTATLAISLLTFAGAAAADTGDDPRLEIDRLYAAPDLNGPSPKLVRISPDSERVTFLRGKASDPLQQDLWEFSLADNELRLLVDSTALLGADDAQSLPPREFLLG